VLSGFEERTLDFGVALHESAFGRDLRRFDPRKDERSDDPMSLASLSLGHGPPIHRTEWALAFAHETGRAIDVDAERELLEWWAVAAATVIAITSPCWGPVPVGLRAAVYDEDDLGPLFSYYIPRTREGARTTGAGAIDLRGVEFSQELTRFAEAARASPAYAAVLDTMRPLGKKDRRRLQRLARDIGSRLEEELAGVNYEEARRRAPDILRRAYDSAPRPLREFAKAVRTFNELLNYALWTALAIAESDEGIFVVETMPGAVRLSRDGRHEDLALALEGVGGLVFLSPPAPFVLEAAEPIDGVYLTRRQRVQWRRETIVDVSGRRLAALERT
jgi:hypothetical protein